MEDPNAAPDSSSFVLPDAPYDPRPKSRRGLIVAVVLVLVVAGAVGFVSMVGGLMKSNDAYRNAIAHADADCRVAQAIGTPVEPGYFVSGSVETSGPSGHAELSIPVDGTNGSGTLFVVADRSAEVWSFTQLALEVDDGGGRIDLLTAAACAPGGGAPVAGTPGTDAAAALKGGASPAAPAAPTPAAEPAATPAAAGAKDRAPTAGAPAGGVAKP